MNLRFAAIISHPNQHISPIFRELAKVSGIDVKVFYCSDWGVNPTYDPKFACSFAWDVPLLEGYEYEFLPIIRPPRRMSFREIDNAAVCSRLSRFSPHAIWIHGYAYRTCWRVRKWARGRCAVLHFGDSELLHTRSLFKRMVKSVALRYIFKRCDRFITIGDNNEEYYAHYGVPREKMFRGAYPIDVKRFRQALVAPNRPSRSDIRKRYDLPEGAIVALFVGKMIDIKRPKDLLDAITLLHAKDVPMYALYVGDGALRPSLEKETKNRGLDSYIRFTGFVNQREMPLILECGDILAMMSEKDPHPLAVTESMAVGNAIVASDRIGCVGPTDSARPGVNTLVYPVGCVSALAAHLQTLLEDKILLKRMKEASVVLVENQDLNVPVHAIVRAILSLRADFDPLWHDIPEDTFQALESYTTSNTGKPLVNAP